MNDLIVVGLGIKDLAQMTLESQAHILSADKILYLGMQPDVHIPELYSWGARSVQSILELYVDGDIDDKNYQSLLNATLEASAQFPKVVLLVPGHPRIGVTLVQQLINHKTKYCLTVLPGISSFDTMINDLERDPLEKGSIVIDANRMLLFDMTWSSTLDCYIYHVCSVGTRRVYIHDARKANDWKTLKTHLLKIYPENCIVHLISSSTAENQKNQKFSASLSELERLMEHVHFGTTLFIPGEKAKSFNQDFLNSLRKES